MARPKDIGTAGETAVVRHLRANGFPGAERRALRGTYDAGDVTGCPGLCVEVKAGQAAKTASDGQVAAWLTETETERVNADADVGMLVLQRAGVGAANAGRWWAVLQMRPAAGHLELGEGAGAPVTVRMHLTDALSLLQHAGYGEPPAQSSNSPTGTESRVNCSKSAR
jgi:hypothetical protein